MVKSYELPLFPLYTVLFPDQVLPLHIFEPRYRQMMADCLQAERTFGVVLIREGAEVGGPAIPYEVGTTAKIEDVERLPDGRMNIIIAGQERFQLQSYDDARKPYLLGQISPWPWRSETVPSREITHSLQQRFERYVELLSQVADTELGLDSTPSSLAQLTILAAVVLQISPREKQKLLETPSVGELASRLALLLRQESRALQIILDAMPLQGEMDGNFSRN